MSDFTPRSVVITGASRGIGAATAREFARAGAAVVLAARTLPEVEAIAAEIRAAGGKAVAVSCDVSVYGDLQTAVDTCVTQFGGIDALVNNAGAIEPIGPLATSDPVAWGAAADVNYKGTYYGIRAAMPVMAAQGGGTIVNISSGAATSALEGWSQYCSAKAAAAMLTRCAQLEAPEGIRIVGLSPGTVATEMQVKIRASGINPVSKLDPAVHIPASWPARAILWLCSPDAAEFAGTDVSLRDDAIRARVGLI